MGYINILCITESTLLNVHSSFIIQNYLLFLSTRFTATQCLEHKWLKRRKGAKLGKVKGKASGKLRAGKVPLSPTNGNVSKVRYSLTLCISIHTVCKPIINIVLQERRCSNGPAIDGHPLEVVLLVEGDTENNNNNNNIEKHNLHHQQSADDELTATKDNLKSFIERWEEHPNSPYVFDTDANRISPVSACELPDAAVGVVMHPKRLNGGSTNSGLSSRGKITFV